jgi:hypothetical protein
MGLGLFRRAEEATLGTLRFAKQVRNLFEPTS